jgi:hypothetical protein
VVSEAVAQRQEKFLLACFAVMILFRLLFRR